MLEQDPAIKLNEHRWCFLHMPEVYTATPGALMGSTNTGLLKAPGQEYVVSLGSGTFFRDLESTLFSPERLQKSKPLRLLMHSDKLSCI